VPGALCLSQSCPPPPAGRQLRNYADLDAPAEGSFVPAYGLLLTPDQASRDMEPLNRERVNVACTDQMTTISNPSSCLSFLAKKSEIS
jgi:hypothetical protein